LAQCQQRANGEEREGDGGGSGERREERGERRGREIGPAQERKDKREAGRERWGHWRQWPAGGADERGGGEGRWRPTLGSEGREGRAVRRGRGGQEGAAGGDERTGLAAAAARNSSTGSE